MNKPILILFADDDDEYKLDVSKDLEKKGYKVESASTSKELRERVETKIFDVIILDLQMLDRTGHFSIIAGIEDLKYLKYEKRLSTPVIVLSSNSEHRIVTETMRLGAFDYLRKDDISRNRKLLFDTLNGATAQVTKDTSEQRTSEPKTGIEVQAFLQFSIIPTGIYRQFNRGEFPQELVKYAVTNHTDDEIRLSISTRIARFSDVLSTTLKVKKKRTEYVSHSPVLIPDEISKIKDIEDATIHQSIRYNIGSQEQYEEMKSEKIQLHPPTTMYWALENIETHRIHYLESYIAAWVTPRSVRVEEVLRLAADHHPQGYIVGYQGSEIVSEDEKRKIVRAQVKAMYDTLKEESRIKYVDVSKTSFQGKGTTSLQKVRLPDESLRESSANCIDGAVLFASLIESAGMNSIIVLVPGHAFVGWETWEDSEEFEYLETTMLSRYDFADALKQGEMNLNEAIGKKLFERNESVIISIKEARKSGIYPMISR